MAHNFNNILQVTQGYSTLAQKSVTQGSDTDKYLQEVNKSISRAVEINQLMLLYVGKAPTTPIDINISNYLQNYKEHLHSLLDERISLTLTLETEDNTVTADETHIQKLILNLFMNAIEAIGDKEGNIAISTHIETLDVDEMKGTYLQEYLHSGNYLVIEVSDTGCGISNVLAEKIFDPFFTTKFVGRGLGLATVLGIVHGLNGAVEYKSEVDKGTVFKAYLPTS